MIKDKYKAVFIVVMLFALSGLLPQKARADKASYLVSGIVKDTLTMEALPFASVTVVGKSIGTLTDSKGIFEMAVPVDADALQVSCLGYEKKTVAIKKGQVNIYAIDMTPSTTTLSEIVVKKPKYSKKNNPAVVFAERLKRHGPLTDPERNDYYNYDKYERITLALNNFAEKEENSWMFRKFPFLWEYVDTSEVSGKPILNVSVKEKLSEVYYRKNPRSKKEHVIGIRREGVDEIADQESMQTFIEDVLREVDLYDNDINILQNRFVSPLSRIAPDFYKFYLTDTVEVDDERCIVLSFYPHNPAAFGFVGQLYVPDGDSTMFIKKVTMHAPKGINLNFIENLYITQEFSKAPDGSRLKTRDDMTLEISVVSGLQGLYARRNIAYSGHDFNKPENEGVFDYMQKEIVDNDAMDRDGKFWDSARMISVSRNEKEVGNLLARLREVPLYYWCEKILKIMVTGYVSTGNDSKFDIGPMNTTISGNTIEGMRFRAGGMTTANLSKRLFARGYVAYGTKDNRWKYSGELEYSFHDKNYHPREFPIHSVKVSHLYDVDMIGQHYLFTNMDNVFLSLKRMSDTQITYHRVSKLEYTLELHNNFSVVASVRHERQEATPYMPFVDGYGRKYGHYDETTFNVQLRYAPGEKFYQTKSYRIPVNMDAPVVVLSHTVAPKGFLGSEFMLNKTELSIQKRFWFSAFGYTDVMIKGGHVWSRCPYPDLLIPNANLSYTIQPESFALMNPMEFVNDSFVSWDVTYWANGAILNYIPYIKLLKLREVFGFKGIYGHLGSKNDPLCNSELFRFPGDAHVMEMDHGPYMEASVGIDNIFKCLRVDYVWRLSYLDTEYDIDRRGLRVALHVTF